MERTIRCWLSALVCLLLAGPHTALAASDKYANVHTIAIVSAVGQSLTIADNGLFNFSHSNSSVPISDWGLDERVILETGASLSPRFTIRPVSYDRSALKEVRPGTYHGWSGVNWKQFIPTMGSDGIDAYVVLVPTTYADPIGQSRAMLGGVGLYDSLVFAFYSVVVVDAKSGDEIDHAAAVLSKRTWMGSQDIPPFEDTGDPSLGDSDVLTADQKQKVKSAAETLIDDSINRALADVGLVDESRKLVPASPPEEPASAQASPSTSNP